MTQTLEKEFAGIKLNKKRFQKLEKEILNEYHKNYEFTMPKQNNFPAVYDYNKIKEIFEATPEISDEKIAEKLRKTREYFWGNVKKKVKPSYVIALAMSIAVGIMIPGINKQKEEERKFFDSYNKVLMEYGDTNNNGYISEHEEDDFLIRMLNKNGIKLKELKDTYYSIPEKLLDTFQFSRWPSYPDGRKIPIKDLAKSIEEYKE